MSRAHTLMTITIQMLLVIAFIILTNGCGDKNPVAPDGSTITINPSNVSLNNPYLYGDVIQDYTVIVQDQTGAPLSEIELSVAGAFAYPVVSSTGPYSAPRYEFYHNPGANAVAGNVLENNGFTAHTDESGVYRFSIRIYSSVTLTAGGPLTPNGFTETIYVSSGTAQGVTDIDVTIQ